MTFAALPKGASETRVAGTPRPKRQSRIASIVKEIEASGPNLAGVARKLNEPKESVSYIFRSIIEKNGYVVQARIDLGALGLRDVVAVVDITDEFSENIVDVFDGMDDHWFLFGFSRTLPDSRYVLHFALPEEHYNEFPEILDRMKGRIVSEVHDILRFSWRRHPKMRPEIYDFKRGRWEFDWGQSPVVLPFKLPPKSAKQKFDSTDIALLAFLIANSATPLKTIAKHIRVSSKTAYRHAEHIERARFISSHGVNWLRSHTNTELGKPFAPRHSFAFTTVSVRSVSPEELARISEKLSVLPFTWFEAGGQDYLTEIAIPLEQMVETMSYLREVLEPVAERSSTFLVDTTYSRGYSLPRFLVDDSKGEWTFDLDAQMRYLDEQMAIARDERRKPAHPKPK